MLDKFKNLHLNLHWRDIYMAQTWIHTQWNLKKLNRNIQDSGDCHSWPFYGNWIRKAAEQANFVIVDNNSDLKLWKSQSKSRVEYSILQAADATAYNLEQLCELKMSFQRDCITVITTYVMNLIYKMFCATRPNSAKLNDQFIWNSKISCFRFSSKEWEKLMEWHS